MNKHSLRILSIEANMLDKLKKNQDLLYQLGGAIVGLTMSQIAYSDALLVLSRHQNMVTLLNLILDCVGAIVGVWTIGYCGINAYRIYNKKRRQK